MKFNLGFGLVLTVVALATTAQAAGSPPTAPASTEFSVPQITSLLEACARAGGRATSEPGMVTCSKGNPPPPSVPSAPSPQTGSGAPPTGAASSILEVNDVDLRRCTFLGNISGSNSVFVGLSASVGRKMAKRTAFRTAEALGATHVVWSQTGTSLTNEWVGKAYRCR